jgi:hypothetical protein
MPQLQLWRKLKRAALPRQDIVTTTDVLAALAVKLGSFAVARRMPML